MEKLEGVIKKKEKEKKRKTRSLARSLYFGGCNNYREKSSWYLTLIKHEIKKSKN